MIKRTGEDAGEKGEEDCRVMMPMKTVKDAVEGTDEKANNYAGESLGKNAINIKISISL